MSELAVEIDNLSFQYPQQERKSLSQINLKIYKGERFGLFGPNGAGKSTLMFLMTGVLSYTSGVIKLFGKEQQISNHDIKKLFGFVPQDFSFYNELSPIDNLKFFGAWAGLNSKEIKTRSEELLEILGLTEVANKQVGKFSGGMKRRINLAIGVIHRPSILFLDEPTVGVDVQSGHSIIEYIKDLNAQGTTIVYTSHQLKEAEEICEKIAVIDKGNILIHDTLENLLNHHDEAGLEGIFLNLTGSKFRD